MERLFGNNPFSLSGRMILTGPMGVEFLEAHPELRTAVNSGPGVYNNIASPALCAYLHSRFVKSDKKKADRFFLELIAGEYTGKGDAIYLLRERLKNNRRAKDKMRRIEVAALFVKAWNAFLKDLPVQQLRWVSQGDKAQAFPKIL